MELSGACDVEVVSGVGVNPAVPTYVNPKLLKLCIHN